MTCLSATIFFSSSFFQGCAPSMHNTIFPYYHFSSLMGKNLDMHAGFFQANLQGQGYMIFIFFLSLDSDIFYSPLCILGIIEVMILVDVGMYLHSILYTTYTEYKKALIIILI